MNTWLYFTPEGLGQSSTDWPCCIYSATGLQQLLPLDQVAQALNGRPINVLLPMELCSWVRSDPWPSRRQPGAQAIAYAVEDQLSDTLERLHLSAGARDSEGRYPVMVINRDRLGRILALLTDLGIEARSVFADADVLSADQPIGVWWFDRWVVGGTLGARMALSHDDMKLLKPALPIDALWFDEHQAAQVIERSLTEPNGGAINLLQGDFIVRGKCLPWRLAGLSLLAVLLLTWGASEARIGFLSSQTRQLSEQNVQRFKALFPEQQRTVDVAMQLKVLQSQRAQPQNTRMADLVKLIEQVVGASQVEVRRIDYRVADGWKIQLTANSFAELEQLRERGRQQGMPIRLDSASKQSDRVQATLTLEDET